MNIFFRWLKEQEKGPKMTIKDRKWNNARPYEILLEKEICDLEKKTCVFLHKPYIWICFIEIDEPELTEKLDEWFNIVHFGRGWGPYHNKPTSSNWPEVMQKHSDLDDPRHPIIGMFYQQWWDDVELFFDEASERGCITDWVYMWSKLFRQIHTNRMEEMEMEEEEGEEE